MRPSNIFAVQRHGNPFDTCRSLLGIYQITLHYCRMESVISDIQKSANSTGFKYPGLRDSKAPACPLNSMQPVRLRSFAGPRYFSVSHLDPASHHVHSRLLSMPLGTFSSVVFFLQDVLHEREQVVSVCSSQSHYYRSPARIHQ